jgi:hypothetical protein
VPLVYASRSTFARGSLAGRARIWTGLLPDRRCSAKRKSLFQFSSDPISGTWMNRSLSLGSLKRPAKNLLAMPTTSMSNRKGGKFLLQQRTLPVDILVLCSPWCQTWIRCDHVMHCSQRHYLSFFLCLSVAVSFISDVTSCTTNRREEVVGAMLDSHSPAM